MKTLGKEGSCLGSMIFGGDGDGDGCGTCAGDGCMGDCLGDCMGCGDAPPYSYEGNVVNGALQVHVTDSLFDFVSMNLVGILGAAAADMLNPGDYTARCKANPNARTRKSG